MTNFSAPSAPQKSAERSPLVYNAVLERIIEHTTDTRSLFLRLPAGQSLAFKPGQFLSFALPIAGKVLTRPYSIASDPDNESLLEICFNIVPGGLGSSYLWRRVVGDVLQFTGPWGAFVFDQLPPNECVFIAEGVGIAPLRPMLKRALLSDVGMPVRLMHSAVSENALIYRSEFQEWEKRRARFCFEPLLSDLSAEQSNGYVSLLKIIEQRYIFADSNRARHFYICGVGRIVTTIRNLLRQSGYQRRAVQYEKW